ARMARQETFRNRLSHQGRNAQIRGETLVTFPETGAARGYLIGACLILVTMMPAPSHAAAKIQLLTSPGGIEAWFVQDATVPLVAMEFAMDGGATQDPPGKPGVGNMVADL